MAISLHPTKLRLEDKENCQPKKNVTGADGKVSTI